MKASLKQPEKERIVNAQGKACWYCGETQEILKTYRMSLCFVLQPLLDESYAKLRRPMAVCQVCVGLLKDHKFNTLREAALFVLQERENSGRVSTKRENLGSMLQVWELMDGVTEQVARLGLKLSQRDVEVLQADGAIQSLNKTLGKEMDAGEEVKLAMPPDETPEEAETLRLLKQFGV